MFTTALALLFLVKLFLKTNFYAPKCVLILTIGIRLDLYVRKRKS